MKAKLTRFPVLPFRRLYNVSSIHYRRLSSLGLWEDDINTDIKLRIEKRWSKDVMCENTNGNNNETKNYVLPMFPYPSGYLHMGHVRVYSISDTIARFLKLNGKNVLHPIGWDAFGLPAENAAIERKVLPQHWTLTNIGQMKSQLLKLGLNFDWSCEISTCEPYYYQWTQYIFLKLYENGLAYQNKALVNWDPVDKTVLADEQVDELGCSWRSGAKVEKKMLTQWFIKTTRFAKKLYDGLDSDHLENWKDIINLQKHWIGDCNGVVVTFKVLVDNKSKTFDVWTLDPYKFIHGQFLIMSTNNVIIQDLNDKYDINLKAINPITDSEMPIYINDDVTYPEGRLVYIACPSICEEDEKLAISLSVPVLVKNSNQSVNIEKDNQQAIDIAQKKNVGGHFVSSKLKDWLISRQRYWGTPIPIIHCPNCGAVPVPYKDLPVKLPDINNYTDYSEILNNWLYCKCPKCQCDAKRESDTMDTFVDSSWYYYRFLDPKNNDMPFDKNKLVGCTPVNIYIGGKEHAVLHLYYARFMSYFLHSLGWTPSEEPFKKLLVQGMVMGQSYKLKSSGKYLSLEQVEKVGKEFREINTGEKVLVQWEKMSKSKHNGENPERLLTEYGCDTTRLLILADVPPATSRHWSEATFPGVLNWQHRLWITLRDFLKYRNDPTLNNSNILNIEEFKKHETKLWDARNYFIAIATYHFEHTQRLSVGISRLQGLTNVIRNKHLPPEAMSKGKEFELTLASLIIMLAPIAPHFSSELWAGFLSAPNRISTTSPLINWEKNVLHQTWPKVDDHYNLSLQCKVDGADRCELKIKATDLTRLSHKDALQMMVKEESVAKRIKNGILKTKYELYPGCRAILHVYTNRKNNKINVENTNS